MKKNLSVIDRSVRVIAAVVIAALLISGSITGTLAWILGIVALLLVGTSLVSFCPAYALLGISTLGKKVQ